MFNDGHFTELLYLPSPYLRYWWFYRSLNMNDLRDVLIFTFACLSICTKFLKIISQYNKLGQYKKED